MAGRAAVLSYEETKAANPCIPADHTGTYEYSGLSYDLISAPSGASFDACSKLITTVLKQDADCGAPAVSIQALTFLYLQAYFWLSHTRFHATSSSWDA